jgi:hypothetical protein
MIARVWDESGAAGPPGTPDLLAVKEAGQPERLLPIGATPIGIGRDGQSAICLSSPYVSRHHARIEWRGDGTWLVDLGSRNGVAVNGRRVVGETRLNVGDVVAIADVRIQCLGDWHPGEDTRAFEWHGDPEPDATEPRPDVQDSGTPFEPAPAPAPAAEAAPRARRAQRDDVLAVDVALHKVWVGGREPERRLSAQEFTLLAYLWEHRDRVCTREEIGDAIWGHDRWEPNMLHRLVYRLKEKIEPAPTLGAGAPVRDRSDREAARYIETVPWVGYRLTP